MKAELTELSETRKSLAVEIPTMAVDSEIERRSQRYRRTLKVPGFRPGKAPVSVVRQRLRGQILQDVAQDLIPKAVDEAIREQGLQPVATPAIRDVKVEEGQPLTFTAMFETLPPVDPGEYRGLTLRRPPVEVSDEAVVQALDQLRERAARFEPVEDRSVAQGDIVTLDLERHIVKAATADENAPAGSPEQHKGAEIEIGGAANPPGFDEHLLGLDIDATSSFTLTYPEDHKVESLAGSEINYTVSIKAIRKRVLPVLDDDFARDLGSFDTLDALTEQLRKDLILQAEQEADGRLRSDILSQLASRVDGEVPEALIEQETDRRVERFAEHLIAQNVDPRRANIDWDAFRKEQREPAIPTVRSMLVLDEIARKEDVAVDDSELDQEVERQAKRAGRTVSAMRALIEKEGGVGRLREGLTREKVIDFVLSEATVVTA
jgi:trigger factor